MKVELPINQIICGDCLEVMREFPDNCIDLLVTDPPYSIGTTSTGNKGSWMDNNLIRPFFEMWTDEIYRLLKSEGEFYINTDWRTYSFIYPIIVQKMRVSNCIVWDYEWIKAGSHYRFSHEFIIYGQKNEGKKRKFNASGRDVWRIPPINFTIDKHHPAEKPLALVSKMIENSSKEGDIILDTFAGSGTTAVACKKLSRKFIGIEIDKKYIVVAEKRLKQEVLF